MAYTNVLDDIPVQLAAGDSVSWEKSLADYPASDGWSLSYALVNSAGKITIDAVASGDNHLIEIPATTTAAWASGSYNWQAYATKAPERYAVDSGSIEILPDFSQQATHDGRSHVQKVYENLKSIVEGKSQQGDSSYSIANRAVSKMSWEEVLSAYDKFRGLYARERRKNAGKSNLARVHF